MDYFSFSLYWSICLVSFHDMVYIKIDGWVVLAMKKSVRSVDLCPFDGLPCERVKDCDDALSLRIGVYLVEGVSCSRAVYKVRKK